MDKFELYMIDTIKYWADKVKSIQDKDDNLVARNVLDELVSVFVNYKNINVGIEILSYLEEDKMDAENDTLIA